MSRTTDDLAKELANAQRDAIREIDLPKKDTALLRGGLLFDTPAVVATRESAATITVLSGPPGCGKTTSASAWLWTWVHDPANWHHTDFWSIGPRWKAPAVFTTAARLSRMDRFDEKAVEELHKTPRLVVDDLGAEYLDAKGFFLSFLDELLNERYASRRPTLITTNCVLEVFLARYGERLVDRMREAGRFVSVAGPSLRRAA